MRPRTGLLLGRDGLELRALLREPSGYSASSLAVIKARWASVISGASVFRAVIQALAASRSSPRKSIDLGVLASPSASRFPRAACARESSRHQLAAPLELSRNGRTMPGRCQNGPIANASAFGEVPLRDRLEDHRQKPLRQLYRPSISHLQRSDFTASGETTNTTVSDCSMRPPSRVSQSSPAGCHGGRELAQSRRLRALRPIRRQMR